VREICAAVCAEGEAGRVSSRATVRVSLGGGGGGNDSTGLMQATEGEMKSLRASAERMADMVVLGGGHGR
jgi:hypothetical protein